MWKSVAVFFVLALSLMLTPCWGQQIPVPLRFERNDGQAAAGVKYIAKSSWYMVLLDENGLTMGSSKNAVHMRFAGASKPDIEPIDEMEFRSNYYTGEPNQWHTGIRNFQGLRYKSIYSGVDVVFHGNGGALQFDLMLAPGTSAQKIALGFSGQQSIELTDTNELVLRTKDGKMSLSAPRIYQDVHGSRRIVTGRFIKRRRDVIGIALDSYDREAPLIIDPTISFSTYLGGAGAQESINDIKVDSAGNAYVAFYDYDDTGPSHDFVVSKISPTGGSGYTTILGNFNSDENAASLVLDAAGNAYITGWAHSYPDGHPRFPSTNALQPLPAGGVDAVLVKLDPQGQVVFSTYLGGSGNDYGRDISLDSSGNIYIAGTTTSDDFPIRNPYQVLRVPGGAEGTDVFVTKIDPTGSAILYSTYLGGADDDSVVSIAVDAKGSVYLAGSTKSPSFAGSKAPQSSKWSGYAVKFNPDGASLVYSNVWFGANADHRVVHAALNETGNLFIAESGAVRKLNASGNEFDYLKDVPADVSAVAVDKQGNAYAIGRTVSQTQNDPKHGSSDAYIAEIPANGGAFVFVTSFNGTARNRGESLTGSTVATAVAVSPSGVVYVGGHSESLDFPTTNGSTRSRWTASSTQDAILFIIQP